LDEIAQAICSDVRNVKGTILCKLGSCRRFRWNNSIQSLKSGAFETPVCMVNSKECVIIIEPED